MRRQGPARAIRGVAAGLLTTFLALCFHVLGGGDAPSALALGVCAAATTWAAVLIGRARPSPPLLVLAVAVGQLILHTAFSMTTSGVVLSGVDHGGHAHAGDGAVLLIASAGHAGGAMWLAHVLAGLLTIVAIRRGEQALRALAAVVRIAVRDLARAFAFAEPLVLAPRRRLASPLGAVPALARISAGVGSALVRRGPPAFAG